MKLFVINFILMSLIYTSLSASVPYETVNIDKLLADEKMVTEYMACLRGEGPCTPAEKDLEEHIPLVLGNYCADCNEKQKNFVIKLATFVIKNRFDEWRQVQKRFDPDLSHADDFNKFIIGN
ncbi:ejaculatory bulb-specific protein 3-like [Tribolium madens]|uniref:ejaculatory bulb-specific protein 3-like n=1 Tax=Tribolium madens TaxID=41895 RepID=UPI001CF748CD|nr:ejaculatory bulb-specific protein 3-like [Tribolium madens]